MLKADQYTDALESRAAFSDRELKIAEQPALLTGGKLRDYQLVGFQWLVRRVFFGESVIIADEMGLGKTIQVLAYIAWMRAQLPGPTLVIVPLSTLGNWIAEVARFCPSIPVVRYYGSVEHRAGLRAEHIPAAARRRADVQMPLFITTYDVAVKDVEEMRGVQWRCMVVDEGHKLKNEKGVVRSILQRYSPSTTAGMAATQTKILLTGTPVQNDMLELWSLCNFILPLVFSDRDQFKRIYSFMGLGTSVGADYLRTQEQRHAIISKLHAVLARYMLRRTKAEVRLDLPPKVEALVYTALSKEQLRLMVALGVGGDINVTLAEMGWRDPSDPSRPASVSTTNLQMNLRKVCCHPYEFAEPLVGSRRGAGAGGSSLGNATTDTDERIVTTCGKMVALDRMLRALRAAGHKVLIFSQFTTLLDILADYLDYVGPAVLGEYRLLTGNTAALDRDAMIAEFNADPDNKIGVFLLSTKAGGLGINLTAADTVIFYDSDWNPKADDQAQDRAHRIGQTRPVVVYRLVTEGASVERRMLRVAAGKGALGRVVLREGSHLLEGVCASGTASSASPRTPRTRPEAGADEGGDGDEEGTRYGKVDDGLLAYWLREREEGAREGGGAGPVGGIAFSELDAILQRGRALQAGLRVSKEVEGKLQGGRGLAAVGEGSPSPTAAGPWERMAGAAPHTPSKGEGYEFVYTMAPSSAIMGEEEAGAGAGSSGSLPSPSLLAVRAEIAAAIAAEIASTAAEAEAATPAGGPSTKGRGKRKLPPASPRCPDGSTVNGDATSKRGGVNLR